MAISYKELLKGSRKWEKGGNSRTYLSDYSMEKAIGLEQVYNSSRGRKISSLGGEEISNNQFFKTRMSLSGSYIDNKTGDIISKSSVLKSAVNAIKSKRGGTSKST